MKYRTLGRTGLEVSEIGIGTEHVVTQDQKTADEVTARAVDQGMNYFDFFWPQRDFRDKMGKALEGRRSKVLLAGHLGVTLKKGQYTRTRNVDICRDDFHDFLKRFKTDYVDVMMLHNVDEDADMDEVLKGKFMDLAQELKAQGKARYIGLSSHEAPAAIRAVKSGLVDVLMFSMNPAFDVLGHISPDNTEEDAEKRKAELAREDNERVFSKRKELYNLCMREQVGLVAMKPFAGGWLLSTQKLKKAPTAVQCLSFTLAQPGVSTVVPGVKSLWELDDVLTYVSASAEERDYSDLVKNNEWDLEGSCLYCNHCLPCPVQINIAETNKLIDTAAFEITPLVKRQYEALDVHAGACTACGQCETRCPFKVEIIAKMQQGAAMFGM